MGVTGAVMLLGHIEPEIALRAQRTFWPENGARQSRVACLGSLMAAACLAYGGGSGSGVGRCGGGVGGMVVVLILFLKEGNGGSFGMGMVFG